MTLTMADSTHTLTRFLYLVSIALLCLPPALLVAGRIRVRIRRPAPSRAVGRILPLLGLSIVFASPVAADPRHPLTPPARSRSAAPPWTSAEGSTPPLDPSVEAEAPPWEDQHRRATHSHPAIHGHPAPAPGPLFPRVARSSADETAARVHLSADERQERIACMARHPSGKAVVRKTCTHTVRVGDTLWDIAAQVLRTDDQRRIARYWPKIHRANRELLGSRPDRLFPGQILQIPDACE